VRPGQTIKLHLWDTSGEERFKSMAALYYRDANAIILVYDVTDIRSFNSIQEYWIKELENKKKDDNVVLGMLGNKCDVDPRQRVVTLDMGKKFSDNNKQRLVQNSEMESLSSSKESPRSCTSVMSDKVNAKK
jgi:small GTP-binding protein